MDFSIVDFLADLLHCLLVMVIGVLRIFELGFQIIRFHLLDQVLLLDVVESHTMGVFEILLHFLEFVALMSFPSMPFPELFIQVLLHVDFLLNGKRGPF